MDAHADEMNPVVRHVIEGARKYSAVDAFEADYKLRELRRAAEAIGATVVDDAALTLDEIFVSRVLN